MIELTQGNLLEAQVEALVNTVNCIGYMGKGIALQFKQAFPANFKAYEVACHDGDNGFGIKEYPKRYLKHRLGYCRKWR